MEFTANNIPNGTKKIMAISRKCVNFFYDSAKTDLIYQIHLDTIKAQLHVELYVPTTCVIELPYNMCLNIYTDNTYTEFKSEINNTDRTKDINITKTNNYFRCFIYKANNLNIYLDVNYNMLIRSIDVSNFINSQEGSFQDNNGKQIKSIQVPVGKTVDIYNNTDGSETSFIARLESNLNNQKSYFNLPSLIGNNPVYKIEYYNSKVLSQDDNCNTNDQKCFKGECCSYSNRCQWSDYIDGKTGLNYCPNDRKMYNSVYKYDITNK